MDMKNIRCYGKKATVLPLKKEKSFIRNFFEGDKSSDTSLFGKSSEDVLSQQDSYEENKKRIANILESPTLFENTSVKCLTPEKKSFSIRDSERAEKKRGYGKKMKGMCGKKNKVRRKRNARKKPAQLFHYSTKYCKSLQPCWSEIDKHDLTIERQRTKKLSTVLTSKCQNNQQRNLSKKHISFHGTLCNKIKDVEKRNEKNLHFDSSGDLFKPIKSLKKRGNVERYREYNKSHFDIKKKNEQKLDKGSSAHVISELEKKFNQSMRLGNFSITPDHTLYVNEDLYSKSLLNCKSPIAFNEGQVLNGLGTSGIFGAHAEKLNVAENFGCLLTKPNVYGRDAPSAVKKPFRSKEATVKRLTSASSHLHTHVPVFSESSHSHKFQSTSAGKFVTSTPILQKHKYSALSNVVSLQSCQKDIHSTTRSNVYNSDIPPIIPYFDNPSDDCLNIFGRENDGYAHGFSFKGKRGTTSNKSRKSVEVDLASVLLCSLSMTLPEKSSVKSVPSNKNRSLLNISLCELPVEESDEFGTEVELLKQCNEDSVATFADIYDWNKSKVKKIGEGSYGEVFMVTKEKSSCVLKVIPVSGDASEDCHLGLKAVISEVKISKCLSELRNNKRNQTKNFIKLNRVSFVSGLYPSVLIDAWDKFSSVKSSYNARPDTFLENQKFVILELEYGGKDMSSCVLRNAVEAESILKQIALSLAVAEEEFVFEHRDLHLGNILIQRNRKKTMSYKLRGQDISLQCHGVQVTLIDFTLSRVCEDGFIYYHDLAQDESLFEQTGDYQFAVYKSMRKVLENHWHECCLYSNVLWLKFLCRKMMEFDYSRPSTVAHERGLKSIATFNEKLIKCSSATDCLTKCGITSIYFERSGSDFELTKKSILISRNLLQKSKLSICN